SSAATSSRPAADASSASRSKAATRPPRFFGVSGRRTARRASAIDWPHMPRFQIQDRVIGDEAPPLVIAEIGINNEGDFAKATRMVDDAAAAGCECVKFQCHVIEDEMIPAAGDVIPGNATESILTIMQRCALTDDQDRALKAHAERLGMIYLST